MCCNFEKRNGDLILTTLKKETLVILFFLSPMIQARQRGGVKHYRGAEEIASEWSEATLA
jgi:hypothetical protein